MQHHIIHDKMECGDRKLDDSATDNEAMNFMLLVVAKVTQLQFHYVPFDTASICTVGNWLHHRYMYTG